MKASAPQARIILDYKLCTGIEPPQDRISLIKSISKESILYELAALNYRLKPKNKAYIDMSFETQIQQLKYFTKTPELFAKYSRIVKKFTRSPEEYPIIFNRQACLFAIEEIINSTEMPTGDEYTLMSLEQWESIIEYLLSVNYTITQIKAGKDDEDVSFESLNPKIIPLNELTIETDLIFTLYRGYQLIEYFFNSNDYKDELISYFEETYGIEPHCFILCLLEMYITNTSNKPDWNFFYYMKEEDQSFFNKLSILIPNKETHKLISIRKSPFINVGQQKYLIADNSFLIEKAYSQFLNDFWFDRIRHIIDEKGKAKFNISHYRSTFGYFFEQYISQIIKKCFEKYKYSTLLMFDQLKVNAANGSIEIADVYFRYNNKIILGQVKSSSIYDTEKFGGSVESLYKNNRDKFFKDFGVNQVVESLSRMDDYIELIDNKFPKGHSYEVYPCIFINDKALQTPLMADTFNTRFQELIKDFKIKKVRVKPLTLIHINDIERLEDFLNKNPKEIWRFLQLNHQDKKFIPPFYNTVTRNLYNTVTSNQTGIDIPKRVRDVFKLLVSKYRPNSIDD